MQKYLVSSPTINWKHPGVPEQAKSLAFRQKDKEQIVLACFSFVRDEIKHSGLITN